MLHVRRFTEYSLTCSKIFCEDFDAVTYLVGTTLKLETKLKKRTKKKYFILSCVSKLITSININR